MNEASPRGDRADPDPLSTGRRPDMSVGDEPLAPLSDLSYSFETSRRGARARRFPTPTRPSMATRSNLGIAGGVVAVALMAIGAWALWPSSPTQPPADPSNVAPRADDGAAFDQLRRANPAGLETSCAPRSATSEPELHCDSVPDLPNASARFTLSSPSADMQAAALAALDGGQAVVCPGRIQSPGPWRRNADPTVIAGTLVCALRGDRAAIVWTTDAHHLVSVVQSGQAGPLLADLYTWWSTHS